MVYPLPKSNLMKEFTFNIKMASPSHLSMGKTFDIEFLIKTLEYHVYPNIYSLDVNARRYIYINE